MFLSWCTRLPGVRRRSCVSHHRYLELHISVGKLDFHFGRVLGLFSCAALDWQSRRAASGGGVVTNSHCKLKACFAACRSAGFLIGAQTCRVASDVVGARKCQGKRSLPPCLSLCFSLNWADFCNFVLAALKRVLARRQLERRDGDQSDKILINFHAGPLPHARPRRSAGAGEIESHLYFLLLHLSSPAIATSPLVIYLHQHGFSAY